MTLDSLDDVGSDSYDTVKLDELPREIAITEYAEEKAKSINEAVEEVHDTNVEWYGFTIAHEDDPETIVDIGLGENDTNRRSYTSIESENIEEFRRNLDDDKVVNGWIHSHADLGYREFSGTDAQNHATVLNYVSTQLATPIAKQEIGISEMQLLTEGDYSQDDLEDGNVALVTDEAVDEARLFETVLGTFAYAIVVGNDTKGAGSASSIIPGRDDDAANEDDADGEDIWTEQEIHYLKDPMLTEGDKHTKLPADRTELDVVPSQEEFDDEEYDALKEEVEEKIDTRSGILGGSSSFFGTDKNSGTKGRSGRNQNNSGGSNRRTSGPKHGGKTHTPDKQQNRSDRNGDQ